MLLLKSLQTGNQSSLYKTKAELRLSKDFSELSFSRFTAARTGTKIHFPEGFSKPTKFTATVCPRDGVYAGGSFTFSFDVPSSYPYAPPKVSCHTKVFHPNIDWRTGEVSLGLLTTREWKPVLSINTVLFQLQAVFVSPESDLAHASNRDCVQRMDSGQFASVVKATMQGGHFWGQVWPRNVADDGCFRNKRSRDASMDDSTASRKRMAVSSKNDLPCYSLNNSPASLYFDDRKHSQPSSQSSHKRRRRHSYDGCSPAFLSHSSATPELARLTLSSDGHEDNSSESPANHASDSSRHSGGPGGHHNNIRLGGGGQVTDCSFQVVRSSDRRASCIQFSTTLSTGCIGGELACVRDKLSVLNVTNDDGRMLGAKKKRLDLGKYSEPSVRFLPNSLTGGLETKSNSQTFSPTRPRLWSLPMFPTCRAYEATTFPPLPSCEDVVMADC
eukprot:67078_1